MQKSIFHNKKIAVVGSGIAGLGFAYIAKKNNIDVTLIEQNNYFGGHSNTIDIEIENKTTAIDTGFLVHNKLTYPNLISLFEQLEIEIVDSEMTLSIQVEEEDLEWGGTNLDSVFGQRINLFSPRFYHFLFEIIKFNKNAEKYLVWAKENPERTLGMLLENYGYSEKIINWYIIPMAAAIWSTPANKILEFPAHTFLTFSLNHHLLQVNNRPTWRTIKGGSRNYVKEITDLISDKRLNQKVVSSEFNESKQKITLTTVGPQETYTNEEYDYVIYAGHADQTLAQLKKPLPAVLKILSSFKYEKNTAYVHSDLSFLPLRKKLWSAWNYVSSPRTQSVSVSYLINKLQPLNVATPVIVTLNPHKAVHPQKIHRIINYAHPLFDTAAIQAQKELKNIQGLQNMYFAGAWTGYGFHEDGLKSAVELAVQTGLEIPWATTFEKAKR
jgi:predicted NAD/FAD-binding protein